MTATLVAPQVNAKNMKAAWERMVERYAVETEKLEGDPFSFSESSVGSILDEIQRQYRLGLITEAERDGMREHVYAHMADTYGWSEMAEDGHKADTYSCGLYAPTSAPMGLTEHAIILTMVGLLAELA